MGAIDREITHRIRNQINFHLRGISMKPHFIAVSLSIVALLFMTSCASVQKAEHKYNMRGSILESTGDEVYLCIGSADGAEVGQEFNVYKFIKIPRAGKSTPQTFLREETGKVQITEIVDVHYAKAKILQGEAKENYIVELQK